ncbi:MAG: hypothetical protein IIB71_14330 [Proteobacteria bacterium]|nr:hypothetical protein [Pseudomonadota bacterium]
MKKLAPVVLAGLFFGVLSWASAGMVSDRFEPFDSETGFYLSQFILSAFAVYAGYRLGVVALLSYLVAAHVGMNIYAYLFGDAEHRAWVLLGLVTTILLLVIPLIFGLIGKSAYIIRKKYNGS